MATYFDVKNKAYFKTLKHSNLSYRLMVEILDHFENTIDRIEQDIDANDAGSIQGSNQQGTRKSCSFTLINADEKYTLEENHPFWFNRKFRLWLGVTDNTDTFYFSKGVYITLNADSDSSAKTVSINGVDKYGQLDGTLKVLASDLYDTTFKIGSKVDTVVRDILMLDLGNGYALDPIEPIIDYDIGKSRLYKEYVLGAGGYYGSFMTEIMTSFGCDIFYDNIGRLNIRRVFNEDIPYWFVFKSPEYEFSSIKPRYGDPRLSGELTGVNKVTVSIEEDNTDITASYTAYNNNPRSPLCYDKIGARVYDQNGGIIYISAGDESIDTPEIKCKDYAEYVLLKETCRSLNISFTAQVIPHLNEGDIITIKDPQFNLDNDKYIINSISFPLGVGEMSIEATNISYLPTSLDNSALNMELDNPYVIKYTLDYDLRDAVGSLPSYTSVKSGSMLKLAGAMSDDGERTRFYKDNAEFTGWFCNADGRYHRAFEHYAMPNQDVTMTAQYESTEGTQLRIKTLPIHDKFVLAFQNIYPNYATTYPIVTNISVLTVNGQKNYFRGIMTDTRQSINVSTVGEDEILDISYSTTQSNKANLNTNTMNNMVSMVGSYCDEIYYPDFITSIDLSNQLNGLRFSYLELPLNCTSYVLKNALNACEKLENLSFPCIEETTVDLASKSSCCALNGLKSFSSVGNLNIQSGSFLSSCPALQNISIASNLKLSSCQFSSGNISDFSFEVKGDFTLTNGSSVICGCATSDTTIGGNTIIENGSSLLSGGTSKNVLFTGEFSASNSYSIMSGHTSQNITFNSSCTSTNSNMFTSLTADTITFGANLTATCTNDGANALIVSGSINHLNFIGDVSVTNCTFICGMKNLSRIDFHGAANISAKSFCCGNESLTDIYFYDDNVSVTTEGFTDNNSDLTIHGIANGNVQAIAENYNLNFEALEVSEVDNYE